MDAIRAMERYTRATRLLMKYADGEPSTPISQDRVIFSAGPQLFPRELEQLNAMASQEGADIVYLEFAPGDASGGPCRFVVGVTDNDKRQVRWYPDCRLWLLADGETASIIPVDVKLATTIVVGTNNRLNEFAGRPFPRRFEQGRRKAAEHLRETAMSDAAIPPVPFVASSPITLLETANEYFAERDSTT